MKRRKICHIHWKIIEINTLLPVDYNWRGEDSFENVQKVREEHRVDTKVLKWK